MAFIGPLTPREFRRVVIPGALSLPVRDERPLVVDIIRTTARRARLRPTDITGHGRSRHLVDARHAAIFVARQLRPDLSLPQLGRQFQRDHSTIIHAMRRARALLADAQPEFAALTEAVLRDHPKEWHPWWR